MPSRRPPVVLTVLVVTLSLGLAGCGGGDDTKAKPKPTPSKVVVTGPGSNKSENLETGKQFIDALAANSRESLTQARTLVAPKSAAARYVARTSGALGSDASPLRLTEPAEGRYRLCQAGECTVIAQIVLLGGKVTTFKVNGKQLR